MFIDRIRPVRRSSLLKSKAETEKCRIKLEKEQKLSKARKLRIKCLEHEIAFMKEGYAPAERYISERFEKKQGYPMNWDNPQSFNEKLQWMKLYDCIEEKTRLTDKYLARDYVESKIGTDCLVPLLGVYDSFEEIDFDALPNRFVMKASHGCAWNVLVEDKSELDLKYLSRLFGEWLSTNYAFRDFEMQYADIKPRIVIEEHLGDPATGRSINDYKIMCYNGRPEYVWVDEDRYSGKHTRTLYSTDWKPLDVRYELEPAENGVPRPQQLEKMLEYAAILSEGFSMVRVDLYEADGRVYFGELTFTSGSGFLRLIPETFDWEQGKRFELPEKKHTYQGI